MEHGEILSTGPGRAGVLTLEEFSDTFARAIAAAGNGVPRERSSAVTRRGDHDLNPGMEPPEKRRPASVLVPIIGRPGQPTILLTQRSANLPHHAGQVSFPGGRAEETDADAIDTALRETEEEIGLDRRHVEVIGRLDTYVTRTGFVVTPIVGLVRPPFEVTADPVEVASIFEVPLSFILNRANHQRHSREWQNMIRHFYVLPHPDQYIWGATAGMLVNLAELLLDVLGDRVDGSGVDGGE
jgi:8-oxo-dGTP pyrophosphatase MutT (NUDIX family)